MKKFLVLVVLLMYVFVVNASGESSSLESRVSGIESKNTKPGALERLKGYEEDVQQRILAYLDGLYNFIPGKTVEDKLDVALDGYEWHMIFGRNFVWYLLLLVLGGMMATPCVFEVKLFGRSLDSWIGENVFMIIVSVFVGTLCLSMGLIFTVVGVVNFISWQFY